MLILYIIFTERIVNLWNTLPPDDFLTHRVRCRRSRLRIDNRLVNGEVNIESDCAEHVEGVYGDEVKTKWKCWQYAC